MDALKIFRYCLAIALIPLFFYIFFLIYKEYGVIGVLKGSVLMAIAFGWFYFCFEKLPRLLESKKEVLKRIVVVIILVFFSLLFSNLCHELYHYMKGRARNWVPVEICILGDANVSYCFLNESNQIECRGSSAMGWVSFTNVTIQNLTQHVMESEREEMNATKISIISYFTFLLTWFLIILGFEKLGWERWAREKYYS